MAFNILHELSDGSFWTSAQIAEDTGISVTTIRSRLTRTKDVDLVFAKRSLCSAKGGHYKQYTLEDGTVWTVPQLAKKLKCSSTTAGARLWRSKDPYVVLKPVYSQAGRDNIKLSQDIKERMFFKDRSWWLTFGRGT